MSFSVNPLDLGEYKPYLSAPGVGAWKYEHALPLTTEEGKLRLMFLGVGAAFSNTMFQSNMIVVKGDTVVFIDLGTKATHKMLEFGLSVHDVTDIVITHSHADHVGGLEELALKKRYQAPFMFEPPKGKDEDVAAWMKHIMDARNSLKYRPRIHAPKRYVDTLWYYTLRGGLSHSEEVDIGGPMGEMQMAHFFNVVQPKWLDGRGVPAWEEVIGEGPDAIHIQTFVTKHIPDSAKLVDRSMYSAGLVIDGRVYISGDTKFDAATTTSFGHGCELLFHDCQDFQGGVHAWYGDLKTLPPEVRAKMLLYHLTDGILKIDSKADGFLGFAQPAPVVYDFD